MAFGADPLLHAVEFRDPSWYAEETYRLHEEAGVRNTAVGIRTRRSSVVRAG